jgi:Grx4 family monothiol glutaredoxin
LNKSERIKQGRIDKMQVINITSIEEFKPAGLSAVLFVASFHEACKVGGQMDTVFNHLAASDKAGVKFFKVDAEDVSDLAEEFNVEVVPTVLFLKDRAVVDKVEGAHPSKVAERLDHFASSSKDKETTGKSAVFKRIEDLLASHYVFLFIKGTPLTPKCKFSKKILEILAQAEVKQFGSFDVLSDEAVRQALKEYSNWPTFPQLFAGGKLVGGVDIVEEMAKDGDLASLLTPVVADIKNITPVPALPSKKASLEERLVKIINEAPVMLFMKGTPSGPQCGFSAQIVSILTGAGIKYGSFDILTDDAVRQGLKEYSDWPTYPQLYANGKLVGGLDIVRELNDDGSLADALSE